MTEPTVSGEHDLDRVLALARHFAVPVSVCVNKWDVNPEMAERIERHARRAAEGIVGRVRFDTAVSRAQVAGEAVVERESAAADDILRVWERLRVDSRGRTMAKRAGPPQGERGNEHRPSVLETR